MDYANGQLLTQSLNSRRQVFDTRWAKSGTTELRWNYGDRNYGGNYGDSNRINSFAPLFLAAGEAD